MFTGLKLATYSRTFKHLTILSSIVWLGRSKGQLCRGCLRIFTGQISFLLSNWSAPYN